MKNFSIITVNHDSPKFIDLCIRGVKLHTKCDYEHIVIDNGSQNLTLSILENFAKEGIITLYKRKLPKRSSSHALSLDWYLNKHQYSNTIVLLDSDAVPITDNWIQKIRAMNQAHITGVAHFRDQNLIHPSCMMFPYDVYKNSKYPSFKISKIPYFMDTGMKACINMKTTGYSISSISQHVMDNIVKHRWCGTRIECVQPGKKLDNIYSIDEYNNSSDEWFNHPEIKHILQHG